MAPTSPYTELRTSPISDLGAFEARLRGCRRNLDHGTKICANHVLEDAECLLEQIEFLEGKCRAKNEHLRTLEIDNTDLVAAVTNQRERIRNLEAELDECTRRSTYRKKQKSRASDKICFDSDSSSEADDYAEETRHAISSRRRRASSPTIQRRRHYDRPPRTYYARHRPPSCNYDAPGHVTSRRVRFVDDERHTTRRGHDGDRGISQTAPSGHCQRDDPSFQNSVRYVRVSDFGR